MFKWYSVKSCLCSSKGSVEDKLRCAPCPPPMVSYEDFRDHALNSGLVLKDVCIIARRCNFRGNDTAADCPPDTQDCPPNTTINIYKQEHEFGFIFIIVALLILALLLTVVVIVFIWFKRGREIKLQAVFSTCNVRRNSSGRLDKQTSSIEMTGKEETAPEETSALINDGEEQYYLANEDPQGIVAETEIPDTDEDRMVQIHDIEFNDAEIDINPEADIPENFGSNRQEHQGSNVQENLSSTVQRNSEDSVNNNGYNADSIADPDSESFHSADDVPYMDC